MYFIIVHEDDTTQTEAIYIDVDGFPCEKDESSFHICYSQRRCLDENGMLAAISFADMAE